MKQSLLFYRPRIQVWNAIEAAYNDPTWNWDKESDGCTGVSECNYPLNFRHPVCVMHDHQCKKAWEAPTSQQRDFRRRNGDRLFRWGMIDYEIPSGQAWTRWLGVRLAWICWIRWLPATHLARFGG